ncbi:right-handed parallel beta-helix repeat-containing protein [bacterium]|nr:right-handed parallel beta-helix repeat-containing protein [bacterium]
MAHRKNKNKKFSKAKSSRSSQRRLAKSQQRDLDFQALEPRNLLAAVVVSTADDLVSPTADVSSIDALIANDGGDGISLREAISAADNTVGEDTITFDGNVFTGGDSSLIRLVQGELVINDSLIIDGSSAGNVLITGDADDDDVTVSGTNITDASASTDDVLDDNSRVLNFSGATGNLTLTWLTITGGRSISLPGDSDHGGGIIFTSSGILEVNGSALSGNSSTQGGGIYTTTGNVSLIDSTVSENLADPNSGVGGGIYTSSGNVLLTNSTVSGNSSGFGGGGIYTRSGDVTLTGSMVRDNRTITGVGDGGGIGTSSGKVSLTDSTVSGNSSGGSGGGISSGNDVLLTNSTVSGNSSTFNGGGIDSFDGDVTLAGSSVSDNRTGVYSGNGGGISTFDGNVLLTDSAVSGNSSGNDGGGIFTLSGDVSLTRSTVSGNSNDGYFGSGGGIEAGNGNVILNASSVNDNVASGTYSSGGGIRSSSGNVSLTNNSTVSGNRSGLSGGGILASDGNVSLTDSTVSGNITANDFGAQGGGILTNSGSVSLNNSTLSGNRAAGYLSVYGDSEGGGIFTYSGNVFLNNSTLSGNSAVGDQSEGGGIFKRDVVGSTILIVNSTLTGNSASLGGGGIRLSSDSISSLTLHNSIVAGNSDNGTAPDLLLPAVVADGLILENSLIGDTTGSVITTSTGTGNILNQPALLGPLADNGGPTETHSLLPDSLAIDNGRNALAAGLLTDQRGGARISDAAVDIGAFEVQSLTAGPLVTNIVRDEGGVLVRPDLLATFAVTFDQNVNVVAGDLSVLDDTLGVVIDTSSVGFSYDSATLTATWDFSSLPDLDASFYSFELSDTITGIVSGLALDGNSDGNAGSDYLEEVYVAIPGDANLDGDVELNEINLFLGTNTGDGATVLSNLDRAGTFSWSEGDFNGDGDVDATQLNLFTNEQSGDYAIFLANLGRNVRPVSSQPVTFQSFTSQPVVFQPLDQEEVAQSVVSQTAVAQPDEVTSVAPATQVERTSLVSEEFASSFPASESVLSVAQADIDVLNEAINPLPFSIPVDVPSVVPLNSSLALHGANGLRDEVYGEGFGDAQFDTSVDRDEAAEDGFVDAWDSV